MRKVKILMVSRYGGMAVSFCISIFCTFASSMKRNGVLLMEKRHVATRETAFRSETDRVMTEGLTPSPSPTGEGGGNTGGNNGGGGGDDAPNEN